MSVACAHGLTVRRADCVRESFWFVPAIAGVAAIIIAGPLVLLDRFDQRRHPVWFLHALRASGGRSVLTTIGTAMPTVAGASFVEADVFGSGESARTHEAALLVSAPDGSSARAPRN